MMDRMHSCALIPAYNEAGTIQDVIAGLQGAVDHILVVDDGSSDATAALARRAGAEVLQHGRNEGKGRAIRTGIEALGRRTFTHALFIDGDMQHLPSEASRLLEAARTTGADIVLGVRNFGREGMPASRYHANRIGSRALSSFVGIPIDDTQCGFRVIKLSALNGIRLRARGYDIETEILVKLARRRARIETVPVSAVYGSQVSKLRPVRDTTRTCFLAVYYRFIERI